MKLELFKFDTCPYCQKVMKYIDASGRTDITFHDIHKSREAEERLIQVGGKGQVPCLFIDGTPLYESLDILKWLEAHPVEESNDEESEWLAEQSFMNTAVDDGCANCDYRFDDDCDELLSIFSMAEIWNSQNLEQ